MVVNNLLNLTFLFIGSVLENIHCRLKLKDDDDEEEEEESLMRKIMKMILS